MGLASCGAKGPREITSRPVGTPLQIKPPLGLPPVPIPAGNPPTDETVALGKILFFSPLLSADGSVSCATCHQPGLSFTDGRALSQGIAGRKGKRNAPTILNSAYNRLQFWDGRANSLEAQASGPMFDSSEMGHSLRVLEDRVSADAAMQEKIVQAFGPGPVSLDRITKAIASYERTLLSGNSPFDRFFYGGDREAISESARRGWELFRDPNKGNCIVCHAAGETDALFTDHLFHNLGAGLDSDGAIPDPGRHAETLREGDQGAFKTPGLRDVARTAPYMHDGSLKTLKEVVDFYVGGGSSNQFLDKEIRALDLTKRERADLVSFLETLTGEAR